jgi:hypothetical protein
VGGGIAPGTSAFGYQSNYSGSSPFGMAYLNENVQLGSGNGSYQRESYYKEEHSSTTFQNNKIS